VNEEVTVATADETRDLGRRLAALLRAGDVVILSGPLGAGKTTLTQGIGDGLRVRGPVTSPTFVIARVHPPLAGRGAGTPLVHVDAYRLGSALELDDLDLDADTDTAVTVIEWGEGIAEGLAASRLEITIIGDEPRTVRIQGVGSRWQDVRMTPEGLINRL
jgi:tRNA threonylcarbamoyladenosine biosynthesis protein TsaE